MLSPGHPRLPDSTLDRADLFQLLLAEQLAILVVTSAPKKTKKKTTNLCKSILGTSPASHGKHWVANYHGSAVE